LFFKNNSLNIWWYKKLYIHLQTVLTTKIYLKMKIQDAILMGRRILNEIKNSGYPELSFWRITTNKRKSSFGVCNYTKREIQLSSILVPYMNVSGVKDTILHEIAHAITPGQKHNNVWRRKFIELGGSGKRLSGAEKYENGIEGQKEFYNKIAKYTLQCPTCGKTIFRNRLPKYRVSCSLHGNYYNPQHNFIITQNY